MTTAPQRGSGHSASAEFDPRSTAHDGEAGGEASADCLVLLSGDEPGRRIYLDSGIIIGRGEDCDEIVLDAGISRRHAMVRRRPDGRYVVTDLGSRNGTRVNGRTIKEVALEYGDEISIGANTLLTLARRDRYEDRFAVAQKMQALGQLAGGVSHDFNNLLGALFANITFLSTNDYDPETVQCLGEMEVAIRRAVDLTRQLSEFSRHTVSKQSPVDVDVMVHEAIELLRRTFPRNVELVSEVPPGLTALGDSSRLSQVFMNLAINAKDAMPNGGTLTISGRTVEVPEGPAGSLAAGTYVELSFQDTGEGIDPEKLPRIFEPFFTTKPRGKGTGLGLATVHSIIKAHGGSISVQTGEGTRFDVRLPEATRVRADTFVGNPFELVEPEELRGLVLVADDEDLVRVAITRAITRAGGEVVAAADGGEALRRYAEHSDKLRLIVLDLDMPRVDGAGVLKVLRSFDCELPVLVVSGHTDPDRLREIRTIGISEFLPKPFSSAQIINAIRRNLSKSNQL